MDFCNRPTTFPDLHTLKAATSPDALGKAGTKGQLHAYCANPDCDWREVTRPAHVLLTTRRKTLLCGACRKPLRHYYLSH